MCVCTQMYVDWKYETTPQLKFILFSGSRNLKNKNLEVQWLCLSDKKYTDGNWKKRPATIENHSVCVNNTEFLRSELAYLIFCFLQDFGWTPPPGPCFCWEP